MGDYFVWSDFAPSASVLCHSARRNAIALYKPFSVSTLYCFNFLRKLTDSIGWMLWHNLFTDDSIVAVLMTMLLVWTFCAAIFSVPLLVCFCFFFFFFMIIFVAPPVACFLLEGEVFAPETEAEHELDNTEDATVSRRTELEEAVLRDRDFANKLIRRMAFCPFFKSLFGVYLHPFYKGEGNVNALERVGQSLVPSLRLWTPKFSLSFSWPHVSFPSQFGLGLSFSVFSMESALVLELA
jgi:hypothetical protein